MKDRPPDADPDACTDYAANHLLFLSEWCAIYLPAWSPELWQTRDAVDHDDRRAHPNRQTSEPPHVSLPAANEPAVATQEAPSGRAQPVAAAVCLFG